METVLYALIPFVIFAIGFIVYKIYTKVHRHIDEINFKLETIATQFINYSNVQQELFEKIVEQGNLLVNIDQKRIEQQQYNAERFKFILTDTREINQRLQQYTQKLYEIQAQDIRENDISKVTDNSVDLSDGVTAFPMPDGLKVQIDDNPPMPITITQNIPDELPI